MKLPSPRSELKWVYIDLDKTLAEGVWTPDNPTREIGPVIKANREKARKVAAAGYKIIIFTSRGWTDYEAIEWWLNENGIPFKAIQCGKPLGALYIDDRGRHESAVSWLPEDDPRDPREADLQMELNGKINRLRELIALLDGPCDNGQDQKRLAQLREELGT